MSSNKTKIGKQRRKHNLYLNYTQKYPKFFTHRASRSLYQNGAV
jgi:hypothetical protein